MNKNKEFEMIANSIRNTNSQCESQGAPFGGLEPNGLLTIILNGISDGLFVLDPNWRFVFINKMAEGHMKIDTDEIINKVIWDIIPKLMMDKLYHQFERAMITQSIVKFQIASGDRRIWFEVTACPSQEYLVVIFRDISAEKARVEQLRESEEKFSAIFELSSVGKCIIRIKDLEFIDVNSAFKSIIGYSREDVVGSRLEVLNIVDMTLLEGDEIKEVFFKGEFRNKELRINTSAGEERILLVSAIPVNLNSDQVALVHFTDITEKKEYEARIARIDQINVLGQMAAAISHEVRNPMTTVRGFMQLISERDTKYESQFKLMIEELDRANSIITEFLSLFKDRMFITELKNLNEIIYDILPLIESDCLKEGINLVLETGHIPHIPLNENEIRQLLLNVIRNSIEAIEEAGEIKVKTYLDSNCNVVLEIQDNGIGIDPEVLNKIGQPFITTKSNGTGLGLSVCLSIASHHNAHLEVESLGSGTTVYVRFPLAK